MILNRSIPPNSNNLEKINLKNPEIHNLGDGLNLYSFFSDLKKVLKIDIIIQSNKLYDYPPEFLSLIPKMLQLGTKSKSHDEIVEHIEYLGAFTSYVSTQDNMTLSLYCRVVNFDEVFPLFMETILEPSFQEDELVKLKKREISGLKINLKKTKTIASRQFKNDFFGENHFYGKNISIEGIQNLSANQLKLAYFDILNNSEISILSSGSLGYSEIQVVKKNINLISTYQKINDRVVFKPKSTQNYTEIDDAVQTSVFIGRHLPDFTHPDFFSIGFVNTVLGGYFGSRLMKNIREDKGLTYGISSIVRKMKYSSHSIIVTDVLKEKKEFALDEIYSEIDKLGSINFDEIELVKNYILGSFQSDITSSFALSDVYSKVHNLGLDFDYYRNWVDSINTMNMDIYLTIVKKYFTRENLTEVTAG